MEMVGQRAVVILRRLKRKSIGHWAWNVYNPAKARPEELRFDLLDDKDKVIGVIAFGKMSFLKGADADTPWGHAKLEWPKGKFRVSIDDKLLVRFDMSWLGGKTDLVFHDDIVIRLDRIKGRRNDVQFSDGNGSVSLTEEKGALPEGHPELGVQMTKEEIMRLPKADRPRSIGSRDYVQYRIAMAGTLPVKDEEVVAALSLFAGFMSLMDETPT